VVKVPDSEPGFALTGLFLPTAAVDPVQGPISTFPAARDPRLFLGAFTGDVRTGGNVYQLDTSNLEQIGSQALRPGETWELPDGTTVAFTGFRDFANLSLAHDPGRWLALIAAALVILGVSMSLLLHRRRVWIRVPGQGDTVAEVAGLSRSGAGRVHDDVREIVATMTKREK
jgi:cytochrome c biogenesis protein